MINFINDFFQIFNDISYLKIYQDKLRHLSFFLSRLEQKIVNFSKTGFTSSYYEIFPELKVDYKKEIQYDLVNKNKNFCSGVNGSGIKTE
jgi:hypothetical protein